MYKYAVRYIKNTFYPLKVSDTLTIQDGQMVLVRTEKGEEALKVFTVNSEISKVWEKSSPEPLPVVRILSQRDLQTLDDIKKEEITSFLKCQELVKQHGLNMNLVQLQQHIVKILFIIHHHLLIMQHYYYIMVVVKMYQILKYIYMVQVIWV